MTKIPGIPEDTDFRILHFLLSTMKTDALKRQTVMKQQRQNLNLNFDIHYKGIDRLFALAQTLMLLLKSLFKKRPIARRRRFTC